MEFAILLPVLVLIIGGIVDFGRAYFTQIVLTNAAREGTRVAVTKSPVADITTRTQAAAKPVVDSGYPVVVGVTGDCSALTPSATVVVTATVSNFSYFFLDGFIPGLPHTISSRSQMGC
ncbi:TadE/TadG family type IV pilus assembly protein [Phycicoccus flavus]|uniref:TadE/TadG family type IV pilus assembly protein n=1 Tax=Phycicoccus flavus TaxID=2502783 RepID=UPI002AC34330|nr:TadE/TadG family type IV pilus assembly protein [Phycicoccus flavus]